MEHALDNVQCPDEMDSPREEFSKSFKRQSRSRSFEGGMIKIISAEGGGSIQQQSPPHQELADIDNSDNQEEVEHLNHDVVGDMESNMSSNKSKFDENFPGIINLLDEDEQPRNETDSNKIHQQIPYNLHQHLHSPPEPEHYTEELTAGRIFTGILAERKRPSGGNSKSLINGQNPGNSRINAGTSTPCYQSSSSNPYNVTTNVGTTYDNSRKNQKSGELCWYSADEENSYTITKFPQQAHNHIQPSPFLQGTAFQNQNEESDLITTNQHHQVSGRIGGGGGSSYYQQTSYNQNFSQTAVDDKQSWTDSCSSSVPGCFDINNMQHHKDHSESIRHNLQASTGMIPNQSQFEKYLGGPNPQFGGNLNTWTLQPNTNQNGAPFYAAYKPNQQKINEQQQFLQGLNPAASAQFNYNPYQFQQYSLHQQQINPKISNAQANTSNPLGVQPPRANSFDKAAKQNDFQQYFTSGSTQDEIDNRSNKSYGKFSAFSENTIYKTSSQPQPGTLGSIRTFIDQSTGQIVEENQVITLNAFEAYQHQLQSQMMIGEGGGNHFIPNQPSYHPNMKHQGFVNYFPHAKEIEDPYLYNEMIHYNQHAAHFANRGSSNSDKVKTNAFNNNFEMQKSPQMHQQQEEIKGLPFEHQEFVPQKQGKVNNNNPSPFRHSDSGLYTHNINQSHMPKNFKPMHHGQYIADQYMNQPQLPSHFQQQNQPYLKDSKGKMQQQRFGQLPPGSFDPYGGGLAKIGQHAPPKLRQGIDFHHHESQNILMNHGGPMVAIQQNIQGAIIPPQYQPSTFYHQQHSQNPQYFSPLGAKTAKFTTVSVGDCESPYGAIVTPQIQSSKSISGTPPQHGQKLMEVLSNNSGGGNHHNQDPTQLMLKESKEKLFKQIIAQFEDPSKNLQQKCDILRGNVKELTLEQTGSRFLQKHLNKASVQLVAFFLDEIEPHFSELMVDNYGNYFCQKLLQTCTSTQRLTILRAISKKFIEICCNKRGTHTIQTMFDLINLEDEYTLITNALKGNILRLAQDPQGTHVVQKFMQTFGKIRAQFIFDEVYDHFIDLVKNTNGLCVVKKLIQIYSPTEESQDEQIQQQGLKLFQKIHENVFDLVSDPYGNFAVTEVIITCPISVSKPLFNSLQSKLCTLSNQKYSSPVIERCLEKADRQTLTEIIDELCRSEKLPGLIRNSYGNYVVQKALKVSKQDDLEKLMKAITNRLPEVTDRKIRQKWEIIVKDAANGIFLNHDDRNINQQTMPEQPQPHSAQKPPKSGQSNVQKQTIQQQQQQRQSLVTLQHGAQSVPNQVDKPPQHIQSQVTQANAPITANTRQQQPVQTIAPQPNNKKAAGAGSGGHNQQQQQQNRRIVVKKSKNGLSAGQK